MAGRTEGRIFTSIWKDPHFRSLTADAQRLFMFLVSQPDLSYCGVIPLRPQRWARTARDLTVDRIEQSLKELAEPFAEPLGEGSGEQTGGALVVIDEDTGEVLIRSLIRLDGIWKKPNILIAARNAAELVESPQILEAILDEMRRLPLDGNRSSEVRRVASSFIGYLENALGNPVANPSPNPSDEGSADPSPTPIPLPLTPNPTTSAPPAGADAPEGQGPELVLIEGGSPPPKPKRTRTKKADRTPLDDEADTLTNGYWERYSAGTAQKWIGIRQIVKTALTNGAPRDGLAFALDAIGRGGKPVTANTLTWALGDRQARDNKYAPGSGPHLPEAAEPRDPKQVI